MWALLPALALPALAARPSLLAGPGLLNRVQHVKHVHSLAASEPAEPAEAPVSDTAEESAEEATEVKLADVDEPAAATVTHLKEPAAPQPAAAPALDEEVEEVAADVQSSMDGVLETVLAPSVVEGAIGEQVEAIERKYMTQADEGAGLGAEGKPVDPEAAQTALLAALAWLATVSVSLAVYWVILFVEFLIMGFVWAFLCMGRPRSTKTAAKGDFEGDFQPVGMCSWLSAPLTAMLEAVCCPHFLWAENVSKLGVIEFGPALFVVAVLVVLVPVPYYLGFLLLGLPARVAVRTYIRRSYKQTGANRCSDCCLDVFQHAFCCCCAIHQEAQFIEQHNQTFAV